MKIHVFKFRSHCCINKYTVYRLFIPMFFGILPQRRIMEKTCRYRTFHSKLGTIAN